MDASQEQTDVKFLRGARPAADGFRSYSNGNAESNSRGRAVGQGTLLTLTAPEVTVLIGGMRVLNTNFDRPSSGVFTQRPEALTNDFFINLLDMGTAWKRPQMRTTR